MEDLIREKWDDILKAMKEEYETQNISFNTWILPLKLYAVEDSTVYVTAPMENMGINYIEKKYLVPLKVTIGEIVGEELDVKLISDKDAKTHKEEIHKLNARANVSGSAEAVNMGLKPNYTFETFVVGNNNNLAHAAALAVAETPGHV